MGKCFCARSQNEKVQSEPVYCRGAITSPAYQRNSDNCPGGCHPYLRNVSAFSVNFHLNRWRYSHVTSFLANHAAMFLGPWACGSECCSSNSNAPDISQKGLIGIQSHHSREKMSKKAREKPAEAGSASVSPYGSVLGYELVTSQPNRLINLIWPECRTWFIGPCNCHWSLLRGTWDFLVHKHRGTIAYRTDLELSKRR